MFYFAPQRLWYLVHQTDAGASYSTTTDISRPETWSAPRNFYSSMPQIIRDYIGNGYWVDFWNVCDSAKCYLFSSDDNGHLYRSETTLANFPNGFTNTVIAMQDPNRNKLFEAANVYKLRGGGNTYLLVHEAIGSDGRRWFRSWTAPAITGPWTALADTESNPFARANNVTFPSGQWTRDISHGEMIRSGTDRRWRSAPATCGTCTRGWIRRRVATTTGCHGGWGCSPRPTPPADPGKGERTGRRSTWGPSSCWRACLDRLSASRLRRTRSFKTTEVSRRRYVRGLSALDEAAFAAEAIRLGRHPIEGRE